MTASSKNNALFLVVLASLLLSPVRNDLAATTPPPPAEHPSGGMTAWQATILGVVEGLTEYLPVSSTGHLLLAERIMRIGTPEGTDKPHEQRSKDAANAYAICIQAGAIVAVLGLYARRVKQMAMGLVGKDPEGLRMMINLVGAFLPAAVLGLLLHNVIKAYLFGPWPTIVAWFVGGVAILWIERYRQRSHSNPRQGAPLTQLNVRMALIIGLAQCLAMWPGVSRSLATILGGVMVGLSTSAAVEFSFLLGVMTLGAATFFDALKHGREMVEVFSAVSLTLGLITAFVSAVVSVKWMVAYLNRHGLQIFGYYRIVVAIAAAVLMVLGWI